MKIVYITIGLLLVIVIYDIFFSQRSKQTSIVVKNIPTTFPSPSQNNLAYPVDEFKQRITKKNFGSYITPQNSPVSPEKFTGFHTGVDVEYNDISTDVSVFSINDGKIIYSGYVNGYGGFIAIQHPQYVSIYGHLKPSSLVANKSVVKKGEKIAILGQAYSTETDNERKHLHFSIINSSELDFRGYVQKQTELSLWTDPLTLY